MTEPRDEIDTWLAGEVEPLAPPPGTFVRVRGRARRRKRNQAMVTAVGAVVLIAGAAVAPTVLPGLLRGPGGGAPSALASGAPVTVTVTPTTHSSTASHVPHSSSPSVSQSVTGTGLSTTTSGTTPPADFRPTSITMVSGSVGAVIGQAGTPGHCATSYCTSLAGTSNFGQSWYGVSAPLTGAPDGAIGVSQLRFLNLTDGWAFGPGLQETSDGGRTWTAEQTFGLRVTDLDTAGDRAFALLGNCTGSGPDYTADCSTFTLYTSVAGSTSWQPVQLVLPASQRAAAMGTAGVSASAALAIATDAADPEDGTGYLLAPSGALLSGPLNGGAWSYLGAAPCRPGTEIAGPEPTHAHLAIGGGKLLISCVPGTDGGSGTDPTGPVQPKMLFESSNGHTWHALGEPPVGGVTTSLAAAGADQIVMATTTGIDYSANGTSWQAAAITSGSPAGGFSYAGMTSLTQGVALPVNAALGKIYVTADGGKTWTARPISGS